jgi:hypothetical protein
LVVPQDKRARVECKFLKVCFPSQPDEFDRFDSLLLLFGGEDFETMLGRKLSHERPDVLQGVVTGRLAGSEDRKRSSASCDCRIPDGTKTGPASTGPPLAAANKPA